MNSTTSEPSTARSVKRRMRASSTSPPLVSQPGGVEQGEGKVAELGRRFAHVARHARRVVDDGAALADQAVEQRRFADVGTADDGDP